MAKDMKLYRYMPYKYWKDAVRKGFAAQRVSAYEDIFEGVGQLGCHIRIAPTLYDQIYSIVCFNDPATTSEHDEMQLWSRYADKGMGVRVSLTFPLGDEFNGTLLRNVSYTDKIEQTEEVGLKELLADGNTIESVSEFLKSALFTKGMSWTWEHEVRLSIVNNEIPGYTSFKDGVSDGQKPPPKFWYAEFLKPFIDGVDFGPRINSLSADNAVNAGNMIADVNEITSEGYKLNFGVMMCARDARQIHRESFDVWRKLYERGKSIDSSICC